jgi:hypothetical protein
MHRKQSNKESKTYVQGLRPFGNTLPRGIRGILKKNGYNYSEIINKWNVLAGNQISACSYPKSIKVGKENSTAILTICVERGNEITVEYSKNDIINKVNSYFGYKMITEIRLLTINSKKENKKKNRNILKFSENLKNKIDLIENEKIKKSLSKLLRAINND